MGYKFVLQIRITSFLPLWVQLQVRFLCWLQVRYQECQSPGRLWTQIICTLS